MKEGFVGSTILAIASLVSVAAPWAIAAQKETQFFSPLLAAWPVSITGHPFSAEQTNQVSVVGEKNPQPPRKSSFYRDSQGRTFTVPSRGFNNPHLSTLVDPVAGFWYVLESDKKIVHRVKIPATPQRPPITPSKYSVSLGSQYLLGVQAEGQRVTPPTTGEMTEVWICKDLQLIMVMRNSGPRSSGTGEITSLQLGDPSPELFQLPADYTMVDETAPFTLK
jgi:hypothetical protein